MGRYGRTDAFLDDWHARQLDLPDGRRLTWIALLGYARSLAECVRLDGHAIAPAEAARLLAAAGHPDAELVTPERSGSGSFH